MGDVVRGQLEKHRKARRESRWLRPTQLCAIAGISYRQADYWARTGVLTPAREAQGSGFPRRYTPGQARAAKVLGLLSAMGAKHDAMAAAASELEALDELTGVLLVWPDGTVHLTDNPRDALTPAAFYVDLDVVVSSFAAVHPALSSAL